MQSNNQLPTAGRPWFREPMVWMVILIPVSAVIVGAVMLTFAIRSDDGLVVDDYYKQGKEINRVLARTEEAARLGVVASIQFDQLGQVQIHLDQKFQADPMSAVTLSLVHRTRAGLDRKSTLIRYADGIYRGQMTLPDTGVWAVQLEADHWRVTGTMAQPGVSKLVLRAG